MAFDYPNPSDGLFTIELKESGNPLATTIEITTLMGERIANVDMPTSRVCQVNLADKQHGIYLLRVLQNGRIGFEKLIKKE